MPEYVLYAAGVQSDILLFDDPRAQAEPAGDGARRAILMQHPGQPIMPEMPVKHLNFQSHGRQLWLLSDHMYELNNKGQAWMLRVEGVVSFSYIGGEPGIYYQLHESGTPELLAFWFVHLFFPMYLAVEHGYDFIHAAAVEVDERPILFLAPSHGGKSTLCDYFLGRGHAMLSDDKVATYSERGSYLTVPSHPYHRPFRQYEELGHKVKRFATGAKPIHALYLLESGVPGSAITINEITGVRKFEGIMPSYLFHFPFLREQQLRLLGRLVDKVPVFRVTRPWSLERIPDVYEAICAHSRNFPLTVP